jgi:hypothetical protein
LGWDATNHLDASTKATAVVRCLLDLGFARVRPLRGDPSGTTTLWYFSDKDYESLSGINATVKEEGTALVVWTHSMMERSYSDCEMHNRTLRTLRSRFGGSFVSDEGRNRYFKFHGVRREPCEAGCYLAYRKLEDNLNHAELYVRVRRFALQGAPELLFPHHPSVLSNSLVRVFLVTCLEDFLKSTFEALLRYADETTRKSVLESAVRLLKGDDLVALTRGERLETLVADHLGFSNLSKACGHFKMLDRKFDLVGVLRRPFRKRRASLFVSIGAMIAARNEFIHRSFVDLGYDDEQLAADFAGVAAATDRIYEAIVAHRGWTLERAPRRRKTVPWHAEVADPSGPSLVAR